MERSPNSIRRWTIPWIVDGVQERAFLATAAATVTTVATATSAFGLDIASASIEPAHTKTDAGFLSLRRGRRGPVIDFGEPIPNLSVVGNQGTEATLGRRASHSIEGHELPHRLTNGRRPCQPAGRRVAVIGSKR